MLRVGSYTTAASLQEALEQRAQRNCLPAAGTTDIIPQMRHGKFAGADLLDISALKNECGGIRLEETGAELVIGALATHGEIAGNDLIKTWCPVLAEACSRVGSLQIRCRGTIGGNLCNASPAADTVPVLAAAGADVMLTSLKGTRRLKVEDLAVRPGATCIRSDEILTEIRIPLGAQPAPWRGVYHKVGTRSALMIAIADAAVLYHPSYGFRVACGSVGPTIRRARECEALFPQEGLTREAFEAALKKDISPISDVRASAEYRMETLINLLFDTYQNTGQLTTLPSSAHSRSSCRSSSR